MTIFPSFTLRLVPRGRRHMVKLKPVVRAYAADVLAALQAQKFKLRAMSGRNKRQEIMTVDGEVKASPGNNLFCLDVGTHVRATANPVRPRSPVLRGRAQGLWADV